MKGCHTTSPYLRRGLTSEKYKVQRQLADMKLLVLYLMNLKTFNSLFMVEVDVMFKGRTEE